MVSRRDRVWGDTIFTNVPFNDLTPVLADIRGAIQVPDRYTVVRLILNLVVHFDTVDEAENAGLCHLGVGVTSFEAFTAGVVPDPETSTDYPIHGWLFLGSELLQQSLPGAGGIQTRYASFQKDLRASRKVDRGVLYAMFNMINIDGVPQGFISGRIRALFLT